MSNNKIDIDGKTWIQNSVSVWSDIRKNSEERCLSHPAIFPKMLPQRLISVFSHEGDLIIDPFAGTGSTLLAARDLKRKSIGFEISDEYIKSFEERKNVIGLFDEIGEQPKIIKEDAKKLDEHIKNNSANLTITSPPYWNILFQKRSADYKENRNYEELENNLGAISSYSDFLEELKNVFRKVYVVTEDSGYCCVVLMDLRKKDKFFPFHVDTISFMKEIGFELDDIIIWDRKQEYNNLRPLGYPYVFRVNKVHEFILIFKK